MNSFKTTLTAFSFFFINLLFGQQVLVDIQQLTPKDGLANLYTSAIYQDEQGFIWISTIYGLNRYDGYNFKLFAKQKNEFLTNPLTYQIAKGGKDKLWLFYQRNSNPDNFFNRPIEHIEIFDTKTEEIYDFKTYFNNKLPFSFQDVISLKINDAKNRPWIVTKKGELFLLKKKEFVKVFQSENKTITAVSVDEKDNIFIGLENELIETDFLATKEKRTAFLHTINNIWIENSSKIWITTRGSFKDNQQTTLYSKLNEEKDTKEFYRFNTKEINPTIRYSIKSYKIGKYWFVVEMDKVYLMNEKKEIVSELSDLLDYRTTIEPFNIWADKNIIWIGTTSGVIKINIIENKIKIIHKREVLSDSRGITEDEKGNIYFNNSQGYKYNSTLKRIETFQKEINASSFLHFYDNKIFSGVYSSNDLVVVSDLENKENHLIPKVNVHALSMIEVNKGKEFLIGINKGLLVLNPKSYEKRAFTKYNQFDILKTTQVNAIKKYGENIWLSTTKGIFRMTEKNGVLDHFSQTTGDLPFDYIQHLYIDKTNVFWLATKGGGLIRWQPNNKEKTKQFTTREGLSHNYLYSVYEDDFNNLWISSDNGIMRFDKETQQVQIFTTNDGLLHNEFNTTSHYKAKNGILYFGGLGGLVAIQPKDFIHKIENSTPLAFTSLLVLKDDEEEFIEQIDLLQKSNIFHLKPSDKLLEIQFSLLNFAKKDNQTYAYIIEGYTNRWNYSNENFIRITNLPYGTYKLKIKGKTGSQEWSSSELELIIKVLKPFYLQWWFMILLLLMIVGMVWFYNQKRIKRLEKEKKKLMIEVKKRTTQIEADKFIIEQQSEELKALDIAKNKFFSNITHEFRTPLTLIAGPTELLAKQDLPKPIQTHLNTIGKNSKHLLNLVNQILDLSKLEVGKMPIELVRYDIIEFTKQLIDQLEPLAENKKQTIDFRFDKKEWITIFDKDKWHKIIFNLLSNAIKFTPKNGKIIIELSEKIINNKPNIYLKITDNGIGISKKEQAYIFNRFHQVDGSDTRLQEGTGIGLALVKELVSLQCGKIFVDSKVNIGTTFIVHIPIEAVEIIGEKMMKTTLLPTNISSIIASKALSKLKNGERLRLLIIENNEDIRTYIKSCVNTENFEITEAENGEIGIEKATRIVPDLIISDVMMPKKNGFEVTKSIRQNEITSHIPIILLTAKTALESRLEGIKRGADVYLTKPFSPEELVLRIYKLIELRQLLQQRYINKVEIIKEEKDLIFEVEDKFITTFRTYILENLDNNNLNVEALAKKFMMSRMQLHRKIKALTNQSAGKYVRKIRLEASLNLLKEKELGIAEVAYKTGFSSPSHFTQVFKKHYNKCPSKV